MEEGQEWREGDRLTTTAHTDRNKGGGTFYKKLPLLYGYVERHFFEKVCALV